MFRVYYHSSAINDLNGYNVNILEALYIIYLFIYLKVIAQSGGINRPVIRFKSNQNFRKSQNLQLA